MGRKHRVEKRQFALRCPVPSRSRSASRPKTPIALTEQVPPPAWFPEYLRRLRETYAPDLPAPRRFPEPLGGVIRTILAQQNTRRVAQRQWEVLTTVYPQWEAALMDGPDGIAATLKSAGGGLSRMKADYIYGVLAHLEETRGELSLRFLRDFPQTPGGHEQARAALAALPGVGHKTVALVLLFDLIRPAMPVDGNMERVAKRLELVPTNWNSHKVERWYGEAVPPDWETRYALHISGVRHGRDTCRSQRPLCPECVLREFCPSAALFELGEAQP